jgi:ribosome-binding protein aMBF1 (putative translation factor)
MVTSPYKARTASLHDEAYAQFVQALVKKRVKAGMSQQTLADALGWNQSIIAKIESVQRRLDIIELIKISDVVGFDPAKLVKETQTMMESRDPKSSK